MDGRPEVGKKCDLRPTLLFISTIAKVAKRTGHPLALGVVPVWPHRYEFNHRR